MAGAESGAFLPAIAGAGGRIIEEEEEFVTEGDGAAGGVFGVLELVIEGCEAGDFWAARSGDLFGGRREVHPAILTRMEKRRYRWRSYST